MVSVDGTWLAPAAGGHAEYPPLHGELAAGFELAELITSGTYIGVGVPRGRGRGVLVIPGFLGNDEYLRPLRGWLLRIGYSPKASGIAFNSGTTSIVIGNLVQRLELMSHTVPGRFIVVGHSLGGVFARALAVLRPDLVSHAISLGGPVGGNPRSQSHPWVGYLGNALLSERGTVESNRAYESALFQAPLPPTVRLTSIYSRQDAIVRWRSCIDPDPRADAIEVLGTHSGLAWNKAVYRTLGVVLASSST